VEKSTLPDLVILCRQREEQDDYKYYYRFEDCVSHEIYARVRVPVFSSIFGPGALHLHEDLETRLNYICVRTNENDTESLYVLKGRYRTARSSWDSSHTSATVPWGFGSGMFWMQTERRKAS
jgi:hypothetical protein